MSKGEVVVTKEDYRILYDFMPEWDEPPDWNWQIIVIDWNILMDVVEKIETLNDVHHGHFGVHISSNACSIQGTNLHRAIDDLKGYGYVYMSDPNAILKTKIESTLYNVVEFLKWFKAHAHELTLL